MLSTEKQTNKQINGTLKYFEQVLPEYFLPQGCIKCSRLPLSSLHAFFLAFSWVRVTYRRWRSSLYLQQVTWEVWGSEVLLSLSADGESCPRRKGSLPALFALGNVGNHQWSAVTTSHLLHTQWHWDIPCQRWNCCSLNQVVPLLPYSLLLLYC